MSYVDPELLKSVVTELLSLVLLVLSLLSVYVVKLAAAKLKVSLSDQDQARIRAVATEAIFYAEEIVAKDVSEGYTGPIGARKRELAEQYLRRELPGLARDVLERAIHAALGQTAGIGASKGVGRPEGLTA